MAKKKWLKNIKMKKGILSKQLGIAERENIPMELLDKIIHSKPGDIIRNPTSVGKRIIKVTSKLERRAILARNLKKFNN